MYVNGSSSFSRFNIDVVLIVIPAIFSVAPRFLPKRKAKTQEIVLSTKTLENDRNSEETEN